MKYKQKKETMQAIQAFEYYYSLGDGRTYKAVADHFGIKPSQVGLWASSFSWQRRVAERNADIALKMQRQTDRQILQDQKDYRKILRALTQIFAENVKNKKVSVADIKDFERVVKMDLALMDKLDKGTASDFGGFLSISNESTNTIDNLNQELANIDEPEDLDDSKG